MNKEKIIRYETLSYLFPILERYKNEEIKIEDKGLVRYINLETSTLYIGGMYSNKKFGKSKLFLIERLINNMMRTEHFTGKKTKALKVVKKALEIIEKKTKSNPLQVIVNAIQNAAPREEIIRLHFGGIAVPRAVDIAPQRRIDIALRNLCLGAISASHKNKKKIENCLADEIIKAAKNDTSSFAISKKDDIERIARSAR
jgi:small subunit ribosomal protein S7